MSELAATIGWMRRPRPFILLLSLAIAALLYACDAGDTDAAHDSGQRTRTSLWVPDAGGLSSHVVMPADEVDELADLMKEAQRTAAAAQAEFVASLPHERLQYLVLWMATTADGSCELVWVRPVSWSPFRIEGELKSEPTNTLESGAAAGDMVSFPIEELADWLVRDPAQANRIVKGASTLKAIEQRVGSPSMK